MSIEHSFIKGEKGMIEPSQAFEKAPIHFHTIILTFSHKIIAALLREKKITKIKDYYLGSVNGRIHAYQINGTPFGLVMTLVGAAMTSGIIEEMSWLFSASNIILFGSAGVFDKSITQGKIIVPSEAYRDEGVSYHYMEPTDYISIPNSDYIYKTFMKMNVDCLLGKTWTTDAFYRETETEMKQHQKEGCLCVEMEISAAQAVCNYRKLNFYPFVYGADVVSTNSWDKRILGNLKLDKRLAYYYLALELAKEIEKR